MGAGAFEAGSKGPELFVPRANFRLTALCLLGCLAIRVLGAIIVALSVLGLLNILDGLAIALLAFIFADVRESHWMMRSKVVVNQTLAPNFAADAASKEDLMRFAAMVKQNSRRVVE